MAEIREGSAPNFAPPVQEGVVFEFQDEKGEIEQLEFLGLILHNFQDFSFYGPVYTLIKHGHLGCALLWALLVLVRLARRGLWWDRRRGTGRRARA